MSYYAGDYEVAVIGAGHAGCEAALACSRKGHKTLLFSISLECVANMPCRGNIKRAFSKRNRCTWWRNGKKHR